MTDAVTKTFVLPQWVDQCSKVLEMWVHCVSLCAKSQAAIARQHKEARDSTKHHQLSAWHAQAYKPVLYGQCKALTCVLWQHHDQLCV